VTTDEFRRILTAFADSPAQLDLEKGSLLVQVRDETIVATVTSREGDLVVIENDETLSATRWIVQRLARLPLLADRIIASIPDEPTFVSPDGLLLDQIDETPTDTEEYVADAPKTVLSILNRRPAGAASVLYLTSDAGEGKTTLISHLARYQAEQYKLKQTDWLLVPVSLGGRTWMRFDDVIVGALMNRFRFNLLFYDAFIELIRLGVVVPALDGFEEMFVEGSAGDAMSALGNLMQALKSSGSVLIAARKAYFEFKSLRAQTRLFDSLGGQSVTFGRLALKRWNKDRFLAYASKRGVVNGEQIFEEVSAQLSPDHPLLTRAVLVRRLLDVAGDIGNRRSLLDRIKNDPSDYFRQFIGSIIEREAQEKWINKVGEPAEPLITGTEHYELLSALALEMWTSSTESLPGEVIEVVAEMYAESKGKDKVVSHQIVERLKQHALIVGMGGARFGFDHPEFYHFFLGEAVGQMIVRKDAPMLKHAFRQAVLPDLSVETAARVVSRSGTDINDVITLVNAVFTTEPRMSLIKENLSGIVMFLLDLSGVANVVVEGGTFPPDALKGRQCSQVTFSDSYFQNTSLDHSHLHQCRFVKCDFEGIDIQSTSSLDGVEFVDCKCRMLIPRGSDTCIYSPDGIWAALRQCGVTVTSTEPIVSPKGPAADQVEEAVVVVERLLRAFMRSPGGLNENTINQRLGSQAPYFFRDVLPEMMKHRILEEGDYRGSGQQRRFHLRGRLETIGDALQECGGKFDRFLELAGHN